MAKLLPSIGPSSSQGAVIRSCRSAARNVMVLQRPSGTLPIRRLPRGAQPRSGVMLVLVQVSSMKTRRAGSTRSWYLVHCARRRATSGRSRSPATTVFFEAQLLGVDEAPDRPVIDLETTLGQFGHQPAQGKVFLPRPLQQPGTILARNRLRLVPAHLAWRNAAGLAPALHPVDGRADTHAELRRRPVARHAAALNRRNHPFAKIDRIRFAHPYWPPFPASMLNQNKPDSGIPNRFGLNSSRSSRIKWGDGQAVAH